MSDSQKITDSIRAFLAVKERTWNDDLPDLASSYAALCREAHERLRRCADYLRQGLRSEAVHLAECQPDLMERVRQLHFPQCLEWSQLCSANGLSVAPALAIDALTDLEAAKRVERELSPLLARHRILSLAKSPLKDRLEIARELAERDSANPCWREEIATLEDARVEGIRKLAKSATKAKNRQALSEIVAVLTDRTWSHPPPADLLEELQQALADLDAGEKAVSAGAIAAALVVAAEQNDFEAASGLREKWLQVSLTLAAETRKSIRQTIDPAIEWLDEEQRRRNPPEELEPPANSFMDTAAPLPAHLDVPPDAAANEDEEDVSAPFYQQLEPVGNFHARLLGIIVAAVVLLVIIALIASHYFPPSGVVPDFRGGR